MDRRYINFILVLIFFYVSYCLYPKPSIIPKYKISSIKKMVYHRIPFIVKGGAMDLDAFKKWNDEYLRSMIGNKTFMVEKSYSNIFSPDDPNSKAERLRMSFNKFSKKYVYNKFEKGNKTHLNYYFAEVEVPKLLRKDLRNPYLKAFKRPAKEINMFLGVGGNVTRTHYDSYENFYFLLDGLKEISLISPYFNKYLYIPKEKDGEDSNYLNVNIDDIDYKKYPLMKKVKILSFKLEKGDMLYIPYNWWHLVKSGVSRNLAVSFWF